MTRPGPIDPGQFDLVCTVARLETELAAQRRDRDHLEASIAHLATVSAATSRLSAGLERTGVLTAIAEVVINLVGVEQFAVFELAPNNALHLLAATGLDPHSYSHVPLDHGLLGHAIRTGTLLIDQETAAAASPSPLDRGLTAAIPLKIEDRVIGLIALFRRLPQKGSFEPIDHDLFHILGTVGAAALAWSARVSQVGAAAQ